MAFCLNKVLRRALFDRLDLNGEGAPPLDGVLFVITEHIHRGGWFARLIPDKRLIRIGGIKLVEIAISLSL